MAKVWVIGEYRGRSYLPKVCIKCGIPSETYIYKMFKWTPPWVLICILAGLLPAVVAFFAMRKTEGLNVPFCHRHRNHWAIRSWLIVLSIFAVIALIVVVNLDDNIDLETGIIAIFCAAALWIVLVAVCLLTMIRPLRIEDDEILLLGVDPGFKKAVERQKDREDDEDDDLYLD